MLIGDTYLIDLFSFFGCQDGKGKDKCKAKAILNLETNQLRMNPKHENHNHCQRWERIKVNKFRLVLFNEAETVLDKTLFEIFFDAKLRPEFVSISHLVKYKKVESGMRSRRKRNYPNIPKNIQEIDELMKEAPLGLNENYKGLLKDKGK